MNKSNIYENNSIKLNKVVTVMCFNSNFKVVEIAP